MGARTSLGFEISPRLPHFAPMMWRGNDDIELFLAVQNIRRTSWGFRCVKRLSETKLTNSYRNIPHMVTFASSPAHSWISDRCKDEKYRTLVLSRVCPRILFSTFRGFQFQFHIRSQDGRAYVLSSARSTKKNLPPPPKRKHCTYKNTLLLIQMCLNLLNWSRSVLTLLEYIYRAVQRI